MLLKGIGYVINRYLILKNIILYRYIGDSIGYLH